MIYMTRMCDVCNKKEQTNGGFIGKGFITRTCDECGKLSFEEAKKKQLEMLSCITFAD